MEFQYRCGFETWDKIVEKINNLPDLFIYYVDYIVDFGTFGLVDGDTS